MTGPLNQIPAFEIGRVVVGRTLKLTMARALAFSGGALDEPGWPQQNLHTSHDKALEAGLDAIIASGTQSEGLLIGLLIDTFGDRWHRAGKLELRFLKPVRVGDSVRPGLRWSERVDSPGGSRWVADVWCENGAGVRVVEGTASCIAPEDFLA